LGCRDRTDGVVALVQQLKDGLEVALRTPSTSVVYDKFFKGFDPTIVNGVLSGIAIGLGMPDKGQQWRPKIFCTNLRMPSFALHWEVCQDRSVCATASPGYQYVFLCQKLFSLKGLPDATDCAGTLTHGLMPTGQRLARTQLTILLHELVDIYLASTPGMRPLSPKVFGLHAVIDLPATESVINPANTCSMLQVRFALLTWAKSSSELILTDIMAQCTRFELTESLKSPEGNHFKGGSNTTNR